MLGVVSAVDGGEGGRGDVEYLDGVVDELFACV